VGDRHETAFQKVFHHKRRFTTADNFFQLGGDSFTVLKLVGAAREVGFQISVSDVFENPRLGDLASICSMVAAAPSDKSPETTTSSSPAPFYTPYQLKKEVAQRCNLATDDIEHIYPASPFQEGLAAVSFQESGKSEESSYVAVMTFGMSKETDLTRLSRALDVVVSRNPIFRTKMVNSSDGTVQVVCKSSLNLSIDQRELSDVSSGNLGIEPLNQAVSNSSICFEVLSWTLMHL
jgi:aryl carrier-like protein